MRRRGTRRPRDSGWKSDMERQSRQFVLKRPDGVHMSTLGGRSGYSVGNLSLPW